MGDRSHGHLVNRKLVCAKHEICTQDTIDIAEAANQILNAFFYLLLSFRSIREKLSGPMNIQMYKCMDNGKI